MYTHVYTHRYTPAHMHIHIIYEVLCIDHAYIAKLALYLILKYIFWKINNKLNYLNLHILSLYC